MDFEGYYGAENYRLLRDTELQLKGIAEEMQEAESDRNSVHSIVYISSRIKKPESMIQKLESRGLDTSANSALCKVYDAVGLRIVCSFESDVFSVVQKLEKNPQFKVIIKKDYIAFPKPNGYRSVHLCIKTENTGVLAEIQARTIAMDFWATLEHQLKYKKSIQNEKTIKSELKRCADEIASVDLSMQTIRDILKDN